MSSVDSSSVVTALVDSLYTVHATCRVLLSIVGVREVESPADTGRATVMSTRGSSPPHVPEIITMSSVQHQ